mgnify:CR=1 FL=1
MTQACSPAIESQDTAPKPSDNTNPQSTSDVYNIGKPGVPWQQREKTLWLAQQRIKRSYQEQVLARVAELDDSWQVIDYGQLPYQSLAGVEKSYELKILVSANWQANKANVLITGGVHGYETSGVQGALKFAHWLTQGCELAQTYLAKFNFIIAPCISPWGYESINRWNPLAIDPNRSFYQDSPAAESSNFMSFINQTGLAQITGDESYTGTALEFIYHIDLHETTNSDNSDFRPALAARDAKTHNNWNIPDGFYLVGDTTKPEPLFQAKIIDRVSKVTHIAPSDENNQLIGVDLEQQGVINYAARDLGLCMGLTDAPYVTTTEVYPDSPLVNDDNCTLAQVAAISGGLDYLLGSSFSNEHS